MLLRCQKVCVTLLAAVAIGVLGSKYVCWSVCPFVCLISHNLSLWTNKLRLRIIDIYMTIYQNSPVSQILRAINCSYITCWTAFMNSWLFFSDLMCFSFIFSLIFSLFILSLRPTKLCVIFTVLCSACVVTLNNVTTNRLGFQVPLLLAWRDAISTHAAAATAASDADDDAVHFRSRNAISINRKRAYQPGFLQLLVVYFVR